MGETYTPVMTNEQRGSNVVLKIPNAAADRGPVDVQRLGGATKATALGNNNDVSQMAQLNSQEILLPAWVPDRDDVDAPASVTSFGTSPWHTPPVTARLTNEV